MGKRNKPTDTGDASPELGPDPFMQDEQAEADAPDQLRASATSEASDEQAEQPPEEGTDPHEDPPKDGPLATMTSQQSLPSAKAPEHPELEPPTAPAELRAAPARLTDEDREAWGERPAFADLLDAQRIALRTVDPKSVGLFSGGVFVTAAGVEVEVQNVLARSEAHLRAIATERQIEIRIIE